MADKTEGTELAMTPDDFALLPREGMSPALLIMLNPRLMQQAKLIATYLCKADGMVPRHLLGKPEACFAVVSRAITWKLDPWAVANSTFATPDGKVGFEGKLVAAILENSGRLVGAPRYEHYGDWSKVKGKFKIVAGDGNKKKAVATYTDEDTAGLGVTVIAQIQGEAEPRQWSIDMDQCQPKFSTLWATDPKTQICYTAIRRFASTVAAGILMGIPFDRDGMAELELRGDAYEPAPPRPTRDSVRAKRKGEAPPVVHDVEDDEGGTPPRWEVYDETGVVECSFQNVHDYAEALVSLIADPRQGAAYKANNAEGAKAALAELDPASPFHTDLAAAYAEKDPAASDPAPTVTADPPPAPTASAATPEADAPAAGTEPIELPTTVKGAIDWPRYQQIIAAEIALCPTVAMIDRVQEREMPNVARSPIGVRMEIGKARVARERELGHG